MHHQRLIEFLQQNPETETVSSPEVAGIIDKPLNQITALMRGAVQRGQLYSTKIKGIRHYSLNKFPEEEPEFSASLWTDGDLVIRGFQENRDGSVTIGRAGMIELRRLLTGQIAEAE
jgi:hypothetical protein